MSYWRKVWALVTKDLTIEWRTRESFSLVFVFSLMVVVILSFAFELRVDNALQAAPGALWVAFAFAGILGLNRSLARERENACLEGLMLAPIDRSAIFVAKAVANLLFIGGAELMILPVFALLFDVNMLRLDLLLVLLLGTVGLAAAGTLLATMVMQTRARDVLLPVLLLPLSVPLLIATTKATAGLLDNASLAEVGVWLRMLVAFDVLFSSMSYAVFEFVIEE